MLIRTQGLWFVCTANARAASALGISPEHAQEGKVAFRITTLRGLAALCMWPPSAPARAGPQTPPQRRRRCRAPGRPRWLARPRSSWAAAAAAAPAAAAGRSPARARPARVSQLLPWLQCLCGPTCITWGMPLQPACLGQDHCFAPCAHRHSAHQPPQIRHACQ